MGAMRACIEAHGYGQMQSLFKEWGEQLCFHQRPPSLRIAPGHRTPTVQWSEDVIKADPYLGRSRVRFCVPPWVSDTIARDHLAWHRRRPCELHAVV